ncbi:MAG: cytochrome c [Phycisphaerales bacterium]|nr:MAG: cytochrome c [Phycisphaerales bacterium]
MDLTSFMPVPSDIPLPLPLDRVLGEALLVVVFLAHILFVNLMVGGSVLTVVCEIMGLKRRDYDTLAREIAKTITVNKSLAVVLGVAPLLLINVLYTTYFYSANALTGSAWILIVPLVILAFLVAYAHKYSWDRMASAKGMHIVLGALAAVLFLLVPLIFLSNINLMLFPDKWLVVEGFLSTLALPNVLPRYAHFVLACVAVSSLFLAIYLTRPSFPVETVFETFTRASLRRGLLGLTFGATLVQFLIGPLVFFTLPTRGLGWFMIVVLAVGVGLAIAAVALLWREIRSARERIGGRVMPIVGLLACTVLCMGYGRHLYREGAVGEHRGLTVARAEELTRLAAAAQLRAELDIEPAGGPPGERVFKSVCTACHMEDKVLVGPSLREIRQLYAGDPAGIVKWTLAPGKKRQRFQQMPAFRMPESKLMAVAEYMLEPPAPAREQPAPTGEAPGGRG